MARPTVSGYLPYQWTHRESNPDRQYAILASSHWTMGPRCNGPPGSRTPIPDLRSRCLPLGRAARLFPPSPRYSGARGVVIPHGLEPWFPACETGVVAAGPRDQKAVPTGVDPVPLPRQGSMQCRYTKAPKSVAEVGVEPTKSPPSRDGRFAWFAYSAVSSCRPRYRAGRADLMRVCRTPARLHNE